MNEIWGFPSWCQQIRRFQDEYPKQMSIIVYHSHTNIFKLLWPATIQLFNINNKHGGPKGWSNKTPSPQYPMLEQGHDLCRFPSFCCSVPAMRSLLAFQQPLPKLHENWFNEKKKKKTPRNIQQTLWNTYGIPSGYVKIAIENGPVEIVDVPIKNKVIFQLSIAM